jgi:hypothetical protein
MAHGVTAPVHEMGGVPLQLQPSPCRATHVACDPCALHGCGVPVQLDDELHEQPYSEPHAADERFAAHGVTAPTHAPFTIEHPWQYSGTAELPQ